MTLLNRKASLLLVAFLLFLVLIPQVGQLLPQTVHANPDWLSGWSGHRVKLTVDQTDIDADLTNFPVLIYLSTSSGRGPDDVSFVFEPIIQKRCSIVIGKSDISEICSAVTI